MMMMIIPECLAILLKIKGDVDLIFNIQSTKQILKNYRYRIALKRVNKGVIKNKIIFVVVIPGVYVFSGVNKTEASQNMKLKTL
jgi:hypothetical protein